MLKKFIILLVIMAATFVTTFAQETETTSVSAITQTRLPKGAFRILPASYPVEINDAFEMLASAAEGNVRSGLREVLGWSKDYKRSAASNYRGQIQNEWRLNGWKYEVGGGDTDFEVFRVFTDGPTNRAVLGFFIYGDDALVLGLMEILPSSTPVSHSGDQTKIDNPGSNNHPKNSSAAKFITIEKNVTYANLMGNEMPPIPSFPDLKPKPGFVRGFVKDTAGNPLKGATIGVRSSYLAGYYSGSQGKTDAKGYYEFSVPKGSAHFYNAGYAIEWGDGLAAIGLHPADGNLDSFTTSDGAVENFVLLPFGVTSRENLQENPRLASTYYGGALYIGYSAHEARDSYPQPYAIAEDAIIEITLTPEGEMFSGSPKQTFVIRKKAGFDTGFKVNNIPLGRYQIDAKVNGKPLKLKLNSPRGTMFGMTPNETSRSASILFAPAGAKSEMVSPQAGGWDSVDISIERQ